MAAVVVITTTGTGQAADWIALGPGDHIIDLTWAGSPGDADLQSRPPGGTFRDVEDSAGVINATANKSIRVSGNRDYSVDVNTHTSALRVEASRCE